MKYIFEEKFEISLKNSMNLIDEKMFFNKNFICENLVIFFVLFCFI